MKKFEVLEHKADLKIKVFAKGKKELFENAMIAMFEAAQYKPLAGGEEKKEEIKISSFDFSSLLVDFLNEVLYLTETKKEVYQRAEFEELSETGLKARLWGRELKTMGVNIKAATYHQLELKKGKEGFLEAIILFDV